MSVCVCVDGQTAQPIFLKIYRRLHRSIKSWRPRIISRLIIRNGSRTASPVSVAHHTLGIIDTGKCWQKIAKIVIPGEMVFGSGSAWQRKKARYRVAS